MLSKIVSRLLLAGLLSLLVACSTGVTAENVSENAGESLGATLAADSEGEIHLAWFDNSRGVFDIYYASRPPQDNWSSPVNISQSGSYSRAPAIAVDKEDAVHLAWYDRSPGNEDIFYSKKSKEGGWSEPVNLTQSPADSSFPFLHVDIQDTLHLAYYEQTSNGEDVFYVTKPVSGDWSRPINVSNNPGNSRNPVIIVDSAGSLHLAWDDNVGGISEVLWATKPSNGEWSQPENVSRTPGNSEFPRLAMTADDTLHLVWYDNSRGAWDIDYVAKGKDADWGALINVTLGNNGDSGFPRMAVDANDNVHLVWNYRPAGDKTTYDILYANKRKAAGWAKAIDVSKSKADAGDPDIAIDIEGRPYIAWSDLAPGNWEILVARLEQ